MKNTNGKTGNGKRSLQEGKKPRQDRHEYETMSQEQNRHGHGRQQNGTEGSRQARGSNH